MIRKKLSTILRFGKIQYSTIGKNGILASYTTSYEQQGSNKATMSRSRQTLQVYNAKQLREMLHRNGFEALSQYGIDESKFVETRTDCILTIAKKSSSERDASGFYVPQNSMYKADTS